MQPPTTNPLGNPTNPYLSDLGPAASATPTEEVTAPGDKRKVTIGQIGKSGTYIFNGIITREEYNPDLLRWEALKNYDIMRRSDAVVQALLEVIKLPILSATWTIQAASDDEQDIRIADWVRFNLFENNIIFTDLLSEVMTYQDFGYSVFEKIWDYIQWQGKTYIGLKDLQSRKQRSIYRWQTNDKEPTFGITQYVPGGTYSVPGDKLVIFTRKKEGENYEGISVLRSAYKHWKIKDALELIEAIRHERQGLGIMEIVPPEGANEGDVDDAIENARQARASEEGVIKHPAGWTMEWMDMKSGSTQLTDIQQTNQYHTRQILLSGLAQFLDFGGSKNASGSRATSQDHSAMFEQAEEFTAKYIGHVFNRNVIKELVDINFGEQDHYPTLEHSKIGDDNIAEIGTFVNQMLTAAGMTPDPQLEEWLRNLVHAPDLPDEMKENYDELPARQKQPIQVTMPGQNPADAQNTNKTDEPDGDEGEDVTDEMSTTASDALVGARKAKARLIDTLLG